MSSQVLTQTAPAPAGALAQLLGLPRLQGQRFGLKGGEVAIWLGTDAPEELAALVPLRRMNDGRVLGLNELETRLYLQLDEGVTP
ncbi:hypothetical protein [Deinococcus radiophilus]